MRPAARRRPTLREYLTVSQAAAFLGVSPSTLRNWDRLGKVAAHRHPVNGYRLYMQADLAALLKPLEPGAGVSQRRRMSGAITRGRR